MSTSDQQLEQLDKLGLAASGRFRRARLLLVRRGYVWITQEGRGEDFWLRAGDAIIVSPRRKVVIEAALESELSLEHCGTRPSTLLSLLPQALQTLLTRFIRFGGAYQKGG